MIGLEDLWIKDETGQPTGSTKDRMAAVVVAVLREYGVEEFVSASTGNSSTALARAVRMAGGMRAHFFCGQQFAGRHRFVSDEWTMLHVIDGTFVSAAEEAMAFAQERGLRWEGGFFNWARREGLKLAYLEAIEQMDREPQHVFQAVSSGMGMLGAYKGVQELRALGRLDRTPALHMVQQDTCAPMVSGWRAGCLELTGEHVVRNPTGLALAILRGDGRASYPYLRAIAAGTHGDITSVTQRDLVEARDLLLECEGVQGCFATAAVVAAAAVAAKDGAIPADRTVLLNLTGCNE
jgi:threonine synthase